jgi:hypothetical protein
MFFTPTICLLYFLNALTELNLHGERGFPLVGFVHSKGWYEFNLLMVAAFALLWTISIAGRMLDLCLSRLWAIPFLVPWAIILWTMARGSLHQVLGASIFALAVQLPLLLLPSRRAGSGLGAHPQIRRADGPRLSFQTWVSSTIRGLQL